MKMKKTIIYGTGEYYHGNRHKLPDDIEIAAYADSTAERATSRTGGLIDGLRILSPDELTGEQFDVLYICTDYRNGNRIYLRLAETGIDMKKVRFLNREDVLHCGWDYEVQDDKSIISTIGNIRVRERFITDFDIVSEIFAMNTYNFHIPGQCETVVVDMGMNIGVASLYFASMENVVSVYGFEPFPDTYRQALENFALNDGCIRNKIHTENVAVTDRDEVREVSVNTEHTGGRSVLCDCAGTEKVRIHCRSAEGVVGKIVKENPGRKIVLKIDVEGSEFVIFESLGKTDILEHVDAVLMEYHGMPVAITELLDRYGFRYTVSGVRDFGILYAFK